MLAFGVAGCGGGGGSSTTDSSASAERVRKAPAVAPVAAPVLAPVVPPLGINVTGAAYWSRERSFMNLMAGGEWQVPEQGYKRFDEARLASDGLPTELMAGESVTTRMTPPTDTWTRDVRVRCTWAGDGDVYVAFSGPVTKGANSIEFTYAKGGVANLGISRISATNRLRDVDCREADQPRQKLFEDRFVASLKPFKVVRFLDWQGINSNQGGKWANRALPTHLFQSSAKGVAVEHIVALAKQGGFEPWVLMPWQADADYVTRFAQYVHDNLPDRTVYVEMSNEVWNFQFQAAQQAMQEGIDLKLAADAGGDTNIARWRRYAQRTTEVMKIWTKVYADRPNKLVRVLSGQSVWQQSNEVALSFQDTAQWIDAFATAPYFSLATGQPIPTGDAPTPAQMDEMFVSIDKHIAEQVEHMKKNKAIADKFGKRYITYEAGQHLTSKTRGDAVGIVNRDPRMGAAYRKYIAAWRSVSPDLMTLYASTSATGEGGAWGLTEYVGQTGAPKRVAVEAAAAEWIK